MTRVDLKGIHRVKKTLASGKEVEYHYAWRGGPCFWRSTENVQLGSAAYIAAFGEAAPAGSMAAGKFRSVILSFLASSDFTSKSDRYQSDIRTSIDHKTNGIDAKFGEAPIATFNDSRIRGSALKWRDSIGGKIGHDRISHLRLIVSWAYDRSLLTNHHLTSIKSNYRANRSDVIWLDEEIDAFVSGAPTHIGRILVTATETGLRPDDLRKLSVFNVRKTPNGRRLVVNTEKRKRLASIPVTDRLGQILDSAQSEIILPNMKGRQYKKANYLGDAVSTWRDKLGLRKELTLRDTRGTAATRLLRADLSLGEIATHMGWSIKHAAQVIEHYVALHPSMTDNVLAKLQKAGTGTDL